MVNITFRQIDKNSDKDSQLFRKLLNDYFSELFAISGKDMLSEDVMRKYSNGMISMQVPMTDIWKLYIREIKLPGSCMGKLIMRITGDI